MTTRGNALRIGWSRSGDYSGVLEDIPGTMIDGSENIVATWGRSDPRATSDAKAGSMSFRLLNENRYFSPGNAASPIAGLVLYGTPAQLTKDGTDLFEGPIESIEIKSDRGNKTFAATCSDGWGRVGGTQLSTPVYQGLRTGDLINVVLDAVGWPAAARDIDAGVTQVPYWWAEGVSASTAVLDLVHSDGPPAIAYVEGGVFIFRDRHARVTEANSLTSQGLYTHRSPSGPIGTEHKILKDSFVYNDGLEYLINSATLEVAPWIPQPEQVVWSTDVPVTLAPSEVATIIIRTDSPFLDLEIPTDAVYYRHEDNTYGGDYFVDTGSLTGVSLSRTSGQSALLTLTAGLSGALLSDGLRVRGLPMVQGPARKFTATDPLSQSTYETTQEWDGTAPWAYFHDAQAIVDRVVTAYSRPAPSVTFQVEGRLSDLTMTRMATTKIGDRITVLVDQEGINGDFIIEQITHSVKKLGVRHTLTIGAQVVEPVQAANPFTFDVAGQGFNQGQFALSSANNPATMFRFDVSGQGFNQGVFSS